MRSTLTGTVCLGLLLIGPSVYADDPMGDTTADAPLVASGDVTDDAFYGRPTSRVPIWAPSFHGLERHLAVELATTSHNGFAGTGGSLSGFSTIEIAAPGDGAPLYDGSEIYLRDGQPMVACASLPSNGAPSPSCVNGGTHSMRIESYEKIQLSGGNWTIWEKSGVRAEYDPTHLVSINGTTRTFRWGLAKVTDLQGNNVRYSWQCENPAGTIGATPTVDCYPSQVTYYPAGASSATVTINLYREARTDNISFATGGATLGQTLKRLKTIEVRTGAKLARAYTIAYGSDPASGRSVLSTVMIYGYDADTHLNKTTGAITGGTTLPHPVTYTFDLPPAGLAAATSLGSRSAAAASSYFADVNGDGKQDYVYTTSASPSQVRVLVAQVTAPTGSAPVATFAADANWGTRANAQVAQWVTDVNGDGLADFVYLQNSSGTYKLWVKPSNGSQFLAEGATPSVTLATAPKMNGTTPMAWLSDVNGDGMADLVYTPDGLALHTALATDTGFSTEILSTAQYAPGGKYADSGWAWLVDVNGDGKNDWVYNRTGSLSLYVKLAGFSSNGVFTFGADRLWGTRSSATVPYTTVDPGCTLNGSTAATDTSNGTWADLNGDGKADFTYATGTLHIVANVEQLCGQSATSTCAAMPSAFCANHCQNANTTACYCNLVQLGDLCNAFFGVPAGSNQTFPGSCEADFRGLPSSTICTNNGVGRCVDETINACACTECSPDYTASRQVLLSGGATASAQTSWGNAVGGWIVDMNGDGTADQAYLSGTTLTVQLSKGSSFLAATSWSGPLYGPGVPTGSTSQMMADINGDGKPDLIYFEGNAVYALQSTGAMVPVVKQIVSELGGLSKLAYAPSSAWPNTGAMPTVPTLLSLSVDDGRGVAGSVSATSYSYSGGLYDFVDRRFLGFHQATTTLPCIESETTCPAQVTTFAQDYGSFSRPSRIDFRSGAAAGAQTVLLKSTLATYQTNGATLPYTSLQTGTTSYSYDPAGSGAYKAHATSRLCGGAPCYDAFGNLTQEYDYGFLDVSGDEGAAVFVYEPNASSYIVGAVAHVSGWDGAGATLLQDTYKFYDGQNDWRLAPTAGLVTQASAWLDTKNLFTATFYGYDSYGNQISATDANGNTSTSLYDATYTTFVTEVRNALFDPATTVSQNQHALTSWEPRCGKPVTQTDGNGEVVTTTYDALCRVTQINRPGGDGTAQGFQENYSYTLYNGGTVTTSGQYVYLTSNGPNGSGVNYGYRYIDGRGRTWQTRARSAGSSDIYTRKTFDAAGNTASSTLPAFFTGSGTFQGVGPTLSFDDLGRTIKTTHLDGTYGTTGYGPNSVTVVDELGQTTSGHKTIETVNARGQVISHASYNGAAPITTTYQYDLRGNLSITTDPASNTTYTYVDSLGRRYKIVDPDTGTTVDEFDAVGHLVRETDAIGQQTQFAYDALGRPTSKTTRYGTAAAETVSWGYDERVGSGYANVGHQTSSTDPSGTEMLDYNSAGLLAKRTRTVSASSYAFYYAYDAGNRLKGTRYPDGDVIGSDPLNTSSGTPLAYDNAGNLTSISAASGGTLVTSVSYDALGNPTQQVNANGTSTTRAFDANRGWLSSITTTSSAGTLLSLTYARDIEGKITSVASSVAGESWSYGYDPLHRLTSATNAASASDSQTFAYDAIGNMTSNSRVGDYVYNGGANGCSGSTATLSATSISGLSNGDKLIVFHGAPLANYEVQASTDLINFQTIGTATADATGAIEYEDTQASQYSTRFYRARSPNGNKAQPHAVTCAGGVAYQYDATGSMVSGPIGTISYDGDHKPSAAGSYTYSYSANGERLTATTGSLTHVYVGSGYEIMSAGESVKNLPFGLQRKSAGATWNSYWLHVDGPGSTRVVTDASGAVQQRMSYRPFGEIQTQSSSFDEPLGYAGERLDENGLIYLHARYLDPHLGRFISADPTLSDGLNRYTYTMNNPISFVDRSGFGSSAWGTFFSGCGQSLEDVGLGIVNWAEGMATLALASSPVIGPQVQTVMAMQMNAQVQSNIASGDSTAFAYADVLANPLTLGAYGALVKGPINYAYGLDPNGSAWVQAATGFALNVGMMRAVPAPEARGATVPDQIPVESPVIPGSGDSGPTTSLSANTPVWRVQPAGLSLEPHSSPYFSPDSYSLPGPADAWQVLYVSQKPLAVGDGLTLVGDTLGNVVGASGEGTMVFGDYSTNAGGSLAIVRPTPSIFSGTTNWASLGAGFGSATSSLFGSPSISLDPTQSTGSMYFDIFGDVGGGFGGF